MGKGKGNVGFGILEEAESGKTPSQRLKMELRCVVIVSFFFNTISMI